MSTQKIIPIIEEEADDKYIGIIKSKTTTSTKCKSEEEILQEEKIYITNVMLEHERNIIYINHKYNDELEDIKLEINDGKNFIKTNNTEDESDISYQIYQQLLADKEKELNECIREMEYKKSIGLQQIRNQLDENSRHTEQEEKEINELTKILCKKSTQNRKLMISSEDLPKKGEKRLSKRSLSN